MTIILVLAAVARLSSYESARLDGDWLAADGDSHYHLRRIEQAITRGGRVPLFDPQLSFPEGQRIQWHVGYDLLVAGAVVATCGTSPKRSCLTTTAMVSTPVLGIVATLVVFLLARRMLPIIPAMFATALFAIYPFSAGSAAIGHVDHHVLEPLLVGLWFLLLARRRPVSAGLVAGASGLFYPTAVLPAAVTIIALGIERHISRLRWREGGHDTRRDRAGASFAVATLVALVPVALTGAYAADWEPSSPGRLHLLVIGALAAGFVVAELILGQVRGKTGVVFSLLAVALIGLVALAIARKHLVALALFGKATALWTGVVQQQPIATGTISLLVLVGIVTASCVLSAIRALRQPERTLLWISLAAWPLSLFGVFQIRFLMMASALLVVVLTQALVVSAQWIGDRAELPRTRRLGSLLVVALGVMLLLPARDYFRTGRGPRKFFVDGVRVLKRLRDRPDAKKEYAVLSDWVWGHHILYYTELSTVASPFILSGYDSANVLARRALLTEDLDFLVGTMRARNARYLLLCPAVFNPELAADSLSIPTPRAPVASSLVRVKPNDPRLKLVDREGTVSLFHLEPDQDD